MNLFHLFRNFNLLVPKISLLFKKFEENETKKKKKMNLVLSKIRNGREILGIDRNTGSEHAIGSIITLIGSTRSEKSILVPAFQKLREKY